MTKYYIEEIRETTFEEITTSEFYIFQRLFGIFKHYETSISYRGIIKDCFDSIEDAQLRVEHLKKRDNEEKLRKIIKTEKITHGTS